jgi:hypothetical protein
MAHPLLINIGWFLDSMMAPSAPLPKIYFTNGVFHEVLHQYVGHVLGGKPSTSFTYSTPLTDRFNSDWLVAGHLHLMAIQAAVYSAMKREDLTQANREFASRNSPQYLRAWRIVNDPAYQDYVGVGPFIDELKSNERFFAVD